MPRISQIFRETNETTIQAKLNLDGEGQMNGSTTVPFFDHMLVQSVKHGGWDLTLQTRGDTEIDCHHTVEDIGIVLGMAIKEALGYKEGIRRYGSSMLPMDDALVLCSIDLSGRPYLHFDLPLTVPRLGDLDTEMVEEFFRALSTHAGLALHVKKIHGTNNHHIAEAAFKAFGRAIREASSFDANVKGVPSTKGTLT